MACPTTPDAPSESIIPARTLTPLNVSLWDLEHGKRLAMCALGLVHCFVAGEPDLVEQIGRRRGKHSRQSQAAQNICEALIARLEPGRPGRQALGKQSAKLPKLEKRRRGVVGNAALGRRCKVGKAKLLGRTGAFIPA
jgi:hypothetical protein